MGRSIFAYDRIGKLTAILLLLCASFTNSVSQDSTDYFKTGFLRYENFIYNDKIKSVTFEQADNRLSEPFLELNSPQQLVLMFDDLEGDIKNYWYTLIHCDYNWNPSNLFSNEYLAGFTEDRIENYRTSFNTIQPYTHYQLTIPGREVRPMLSGNYLLKVYVEGEPDKPVLTRRM